MDKQTNKKQKQTHKCKNSLMVAREEEGRGIGKMCKGEWETQASSYGMSKSQE